ncbi:hypothetical protein AMS68_006595 [Peltaster fructicola]|uniref:Copper transport protein n=1 Tax=Peltaster fructicola TaxID=286661 RepID=A0A6H0Y2K0_9PEZI|nr:hypothetical protein AMS68_006595 [Peltaster fructicola]
MDMSDMSGMSSSSMSASMVFTTDHSTPLYSSQWTPTTTGAYAGTCIFLIILAIINRLIAAWRHIMETKWRAQASQRKYVVLAGETSADRERQYGLDGSEKNEEATLTLRGMDERVKVVRNPKKAGLGVQPWRLYTDLPRACLHTLWAGVSYLLMLAVMTLNVGYFLSVLAGLFIGELFVGRYTTLDDGHH